jgi:hypothetical protein
VWIWRDDDKAAEDELMQMGICPAEGGLDELMHLGEIEAFRNEQGAPDPPDGQFGHERQIAGDQAVRNVHVARRDRCPLITGRRRYDWSRNAP